MFRKKEKLNLKFSYLYNFKEKYHEMWNTNSDMISREKFMKFEI